MLIYEKRSYFNSSLILIFFSKFFFLHYLNGWQWNKKEFRETRILWNFIIYKTNFFFLQKWAKVNEKLTSFCEYIFIFTQIRSMICI